MKQSITKNKWFWVILVVVALAALGNILGLYDKEPQTSNPISQEQDDSVITVANDIPDKEKLTAAIDDLIDDGFKGNGYFCELLTLSDESGYRVDIQLPANVQKPESTQLIEELLRDIKNLQEDSIKEIKISVLNQMQIVDEYWWPLDEEDNN